MNHVLALKSDGTVLAWGKNTYGQCNVPAGLSGVVDVVAGDEHSLALKVDGTVVHWGRTAISGQALTPPAGLSGVSQLTAGLYHSAALKGDGSAILWGWTGTDPLPASLQVPVGVSGIAQIVAGYNSNAVRLAGGTVVAWGFNDGGQTDVPAGLTGATDLISGDRNILALKADGSIVQWGKFFSEGTPAFSLSAPPAGLGPVKKASSSITHSLAIVDARLPVIATTLPSVTAVGSFYSMTKLGGGTMDVSFVRGALPPGVTYANTFVSGVPTTAGTFNFVVKFADATSLGSKVVYRLMSITVLPAALPVVSVPPVSQVANAGQNVSFTVSPSRQEVLTYQWRKGGTPIVGATN
ncbi:MAG: hypothetical protein RL077_6140 [Verrucomicrobiota bacterium]